MMILDKLLILKYVVVLGGGYLLGSVPFGILVGKTFRGIDVRDYGSGNIGAANAMRSLGPALAALVLAGDVTKGALSTYLSGLFGPPRIDPVLASVLGGLAAIIGHNFSCFLKFKGGKGIATSLGVFLVLSCKSAFIVVALFTLVVWITRISSLGSLLGAVILPFLMFYFREPLLVCYFGILAAVFAIYTHRDNLKRIIAGRELKVTPANSRPQAEDEKDDR